MHKKIGIIGGLSPESTVSYYLHITRNYFERCGDHGYPEIIIYSVNLENYHRWRSDNRWDLIAEDLVSVANKLQKAGADFGLIATNTMHKVFNEVQLKTTLPLISIVEITALQAKQQNLTKLGLLGTSNTMSEMFYRSGLEKHGLEVIVPSPADQELVHNIIVDELVCAKVLEQSRTIYSKIIDKLVGQGAKGIVLGCTEIPLLIKQESFSIPLLDTASLHAEAALRRATKN
jgi:aspartate racemase